MLESQNLMPFFHVDLLKLPKYNSGSSSSGSGSGSGSGSSSTSSGGSSSDRIDIS